MSMKQTENVLPLGPDDLADVMELERQCFRTRWTREQFLLGLERGAFHILGVRERGVLIAYAAYSVIVDEMELMNIGVHPFYRRKGHAKELMAEMLRRCRERGVVAGFLEVRTSNAGAIALYRRFGFEQKGLRKGYYPDNGEDALLFRLDFPARTGAE